MQYWYVKQIQSLKDKLNASIADPIDMSLVWASDLCLKYTSWK